MPEEDGTVQEAAPAQEPAPVQEETAPVQEAPVIPTMSGVRDAIYQAGVDLQAIAEAHVNTAHNPEDIASQVDAEYARVAAHLGWLANHLHDLAANPRPKPEDYSAKP
jgi:hypothetical protein